MKAIYLILWKIDLKHIRALAYNCKSFISNMLFFLKYWCPFFLSQGFKLFWQKVILDDFEILLSLFLKSWIVFMIFFWLRLIERYNNIFFQKLSLLLVCCYFTHQTKAILFWQNFKDKSFILIWNLSKFFYYCIFWV